MKKGILWFVAVLGIIAVGLYYWFYLTPDKNVSAFYLIPKDAMYVVETGTPIESWNRLSKSDVWKFLKKQEYFGEIGHNADYLDSLINDNSTLFSLFGNRDLLISAHKTKAKDYDFLFLVNLKKGSKIGFIEETLEQILKSSGLRVETKEFKNKSILSAYNRATKETLYFSIVQNYLLCSYTNQLIESSIMEVEEPHLGRDEKFLNIYQETPEDGLAKLYINYSYLDDFMACYTDQPNPMIKDLSKVMNYSGLKVEVEDEFAGLEGFTNISDSLDSYLKALMLSGKGDIKAHEILPARTAIYHTLGFKSGEEFYKNLVDVLQTDEKTWGEFESNKNTVERFLKIDLERDMLSWVGDEVAYVENEPSKYTEHLDDIMVVMKANSINYAKERLDFIADQVKKRSPAKFKKVDYKDYTIKFLDIKGVFRMFFGKLFSKLEKPYYTIVGDYVVFSNNPRTIISLIEDYESKNTLSNDEKFKDFLDKFNQESTVFSYIASNRAFPLFVKKLDATTKAGVAKNEVYFRSFSDLGFQLTERDDKFFTKVRMNFLEYIPDTGVVAIDSLADAEEDAAAMLDSMDDVQRFLMTKFEHNVIRDFYGNSDNLRFEAETKRGDLHGRYREFYETGELKVYGRYRRGEKRGVWHYYNKDGTLQRKERFGIVGKMIGKLEDELE
jgi:hypothetical protein